MTGQRLLHYQILEKLGEGGMGVVYKARDTHLDRFVAIKVLPPEKVSDPTRKARFIQEARAASALNHPNIITIHDISNENGMDFIVMEFVDGKTLDQIIPRKGMRLNEALKISTQIADALARAHAAGIIHRDLKPANIMVDTHGQVKVLDFGLAKLTEQGDPSGASTATAAVQTDEGTIAGTAAYMSPEQAEGKTVNARSDIFSFGAVLYEMVTGQRPFRGDSKMSTLAAVLQKEPAPLGMDIPRDLQKLINHCLRKDPQRRIGHMDDVRLALEDLKEESESGLLSDGLHIGGRPRVRFVWWAGALLLLASAAVGLWLANRIQPAVMSVRPLASYEGNEWSPSFSPDAARVAFEWDGEDPGGIGVPYRSGIYVKLLDEARPLRLTDSGAPSWSPDGNTILIGRRLEGRLVFSTMPAIPGPEKTVREVDRKASGLGLRHPLAAWLPDSKGVVFFDGQILSLETGNLSRIWTPPSGSAVARDNCVAVSQNGRMIAFSRFTSMGRAEIHVLEIDSNLRPIGQPRKVTSLNALALNPAFTAGGEELLFVLRRSWFGGGSLYRVPVSGNGEAVLLPVGQEVSIGVATSTRPDRFTFVQQQFDSNIYRLPLNAQGEPPPPPVRMIASSRLDYCPAYSPDGKEIAFISDRLGHMGIWKCKADGSDPVELFSQPDGFADWPTWSPDGKHIVFSVSGRNHREVWIIPSQGGTPVQLTDRTADNHLPNFSRDGKSVYFGSTRSGTFQVWKMPVLGGPPVQLTQRGGLGGIESPDGMWVYYYSQTRNPHGIWRASATGGEETEFIPLARHHSSAVVAEGIYYLSLSETTGDYTVQFKNSRTGDEKTVVNLGKRIDQGMSISPDRRSLLFVKEEGSGRDLMLVENFR